MKKVKLILAMTAGGALFASAANAQIASQAYVDRQDTVLQGQIGTLDNLETDAKSNLVVAVNELVGTIAGLESDMDNYETLQNANTHRGRTTDLEGIVGTTTLTTSASTVTAAVNEVKTTADAAAVRLPAGTGTGAFAIVTPAGNYEPATGPGGVPLTVNTLRIHVTEEVMNAIEGELDGTYEKLTDADAHRLRTGQLETDRGTMASLETTHKTTLVGAINEVVTDFTTVIPNIPAECATMADGCVLATRGGSVYWEPVTRYEEPIH